jgi:hypothetical protein
VQTTIVLGNEHQSRERHLTASCVVPYLWQSPEPRTS